MARKVWQSTMTHHPNGSPLSTEIALMMRHARKVADAATELVNGNFPNRRKGPKDDLVYRWSLLALANARSAIDLVELHSPTSAWALLRPACEAFCKSVWVRNDAPDDVTQWPLPTIETAAHKFWERISNNPSEKQLAAMNEFDRATMETFNEMLHQRIDGHSRLSRINDAAHGCTYFSWWWVHPDGYGLNAISEEMAVDPAVKATGLVLIVVGRLLDYLNAPDHLRRRHLDLQKEWLPTNARYHDPNR